MLGYVESFEWCLEYRKHDRSVGETMDCQLPKEQDVFSLLLLFCLLFSKVISICFINEK